jgi:hypothetical protein
MTSKVISQKMNRIFTSVFLFTGLLIFSGAFKGLAEKIETPTASMPLYATYRKELASKGWLPVPQQKLGSRADIPEVICGASGRLCTAYWLYSKPVENRQRRFILWDSRRGLVVAPYLSPN